MKNNEFPMLVYQDEAYKQKTRNEIAGAKAALQNLLDEWNSMEDLPKITNYRDLFKLIHVPQKFYSDQFQAEGKKPVQGSFALQPGVNLKFTTVPVPNSLYVKAREAKQQIMNGHLELWSIDENGKIVLDETAAQNLVNSMDVIAENIEQKKFIDAVISYKEAGNYLHDCLINGTTLGFSFSTPYEIIERHSGNILRVEIVPDALRSMVKEL